MKKLLHAVESSPYHAIFLFALVVRLIYLYQASLNNPLLDYPQMDANEYVTWARKILRGEFLHDWVTYTPMYPLYLAPFLAVLKNAYAIFAAFHVIGALQAVVVGKIAEEVFSRKIGIVAALLAATYWPFVLYEATFHAENLTLIAISASLLFLLKAIDGRPRYFLWSGVFFAVAALTRSNLYLFIPVAVVAVAASILRAFLRRSEDAPVGRGDIPCPCGSGRRLPKCCVSIKVALRRLALKKTWALAAFLLPITVLTTPLLLWNYRLTGDLMLRGQGPLSVYLGNNPDFEGFAPRSGLDFRNLLYEPTAEGYTTQASQETYWWNRTKQVIRERPGDWLRLQGRKLLMNLNAFEVSQEFDIQFYRKQSWWLSLPWPGAGLVLPLGIIGMVLVGFRDPKSRILSAFVILYFLSIFPVQVAARYRLPMFPVLIVFAAYSVVFYVDLFRARAWPRLGKYLALVLFGFAVSVPDYLNLREKNRIHTTYQVAHKALDQLRDPATAAIYYQKSMQLYPDDYNSAFWLAFVRLQQGNTSLAAKYLRRILEKKPKSPDVWWLLGESYAREGNYQEAMKAVDRALALAPVHERALALKERLNRMQPGSDKK
jgi:tetratricopeptide (TPR) repeat protein